MRGGTPFKVDLEGGEAELGGWASLEHLFEDQKARQFDQQLEHASMYRQVFSSPAGKYVLEDMMQLFLRQRIVRPGDDAYAIGIRQGQADCVSRILAMIEFANSGGGRPTGTPALKG